MYVCVCENGARWVCVCSEGVVCVGYVCVSVWCMCRVRAVYVLVVCEGCV